MIVVAAVLSTIALSVALTSWAFRPRRPKMTTQELLNVPNIQELLQQANEKLQKRSGSENSRMTLEVASPWTDPQERQQHKNGFMTGRDFQWMIAGGDLRNATPETLQSMTRDIEKDPTLQSVLQQANDYLLECVLRFSERYGMGPIVCRDATTQEFLGSIHLVPPVYHNSPLLYQLHFLRSVVPLGRFSSWSNPDMEARFDASCRALEEQHQQVMTRTETKSNTTQKQPHLYVLNLGVAPAAQGKGVGKLLMSVASAIAANGGGHDHQQHDATTTTTVSSPDEKSSNHTAIPLYLECHEGNVTFYERCGLRVAKRYEIVQTAAPDQMAPSILPYFAMVTK